MVHQDSDDKGKLPIKEAIRFLDEHFRMIRTVSEWADKMGYPRSTFWRKFDEYFDESPRTLLIEKKKEVLGTYLKAYPQCRFKEAAKAIHLSNGNDLYRFVKRQFQCTPTELKKRVLEKVELEFLRQKEETKK